MRHDGRADRSGADGPALTAREGQVLAMVADGMTNVQIAAAIKVSERTVAKHLEHVYAKLQVSNRTAAAARARELGAL